MVDSKWGLMVHRVSTPADLPSPPLYDGAHLFDYSRSGAEGEGVHS
jgi:hypothetical protein